MLIEYLDEAQKHARFEATEQGRVFGSLQGAPGVWAENQTQEQWAVELREVLEEWLILTLRRGEKLPVFGELDLNLVGQHA